MAFDLYCSVNGYQNSLPTIREWLQDGRPTVRRAVSEWASHMDQPGVFQMNHPANGHCPALCVEKQTKSDYVRRSAGNALRDISKKFPELIEAELSSWDISDKRVAQVHKLADRYLMEKRAARL